MVNYEAHPIADIFPMMNDLDFENLKKDIKENGFDEERAILLYEDKILDGRNRFKACQELGINPIFRNYEGNDPIYYVISNNLNRRHLNESQRAIVAMRLANMPSNRPISSSKELLISQEDAGNLMHISVAQIKRAKEIQEKNPEAIKEIEKGLITIGHVYGDLKRQEAETPEWLRYLDVWNFKENTGDGLSNLPPEIIKNLLYYFTKEKDKVSDMFAGSGLTYKICQEMDRYCVCSDINPKEDFIIKSDALNLPEEMLNSDFIFLDPPYWNMVDYGEGWSSLSLENFYKEFEKLTNECDRILKYKGYLALIIMPMDKNGKYIDLGFECYKILERKFKVVKRLCVPLSRNWAFDTRLEISKSNKTILTASLRDLIIFQKK